MMECLLVLALLYVLALWGRWGQPGMEELKKWRYAHRGLHNEEKPENSLPAFQAAMEAGFGMELDVHLLRDGGLAVIHDSDLERVTGQTGNVEDLTIEQLESYQLQGTQETIPTFQQVLELVNGKVPLIVELKTYRGNSARLTETVCCALENYPGAYCLESFDPYCVHWLKTNRPELIRGQLAENTLGSHSSYPWLARLITTLCLQNFLTRPDFVAYRFKDRKNISCWMLRWLEKLPLFSWTIRSQEDLETAEKEGWIPIFEGFLPEKKAEQPDESGEM